VVAGRGFFMRKFFCVQPFFPFCFGWERIKSRKQIKSQNFFGEFNGGSGKFF
jgi:hypothetical protein